MLIQHPDALIGLLSRLDLALLYHAIDDTLADTNTSASSTDTNDALFVKVIDRQTAGFQSCQDASQGDSRGRLNVIVEAADLVLILVKEVVCMGVFEVLELDQSIYNNGKGLLKLEEYIR